MFDTENILHLLLSFSFPPVSFPALEMEINHKLVLRWNERFFCSLFFSSAASEILLSTAAGY